LEKGEALNFQMTDTGAADHFHSNEHEFYEDAKIHFLEKGEWEDAIDQKKRESFLICKYKTLQSQGGGLNKKAGIFSDFYGKI
jgi:hypothetical protein